MKASISNRIIMPTEDEETYRAVKDALHYEFPGQGIRNPKPESYLDVRKINKDWYSIPVGRIDLIPEHYDIQDKRISVSARFPKFRGVLRPSQREIRDEFTDNSLIKAKVGFGKTFTALAIAEKMKQKTLVIAHTAKLREQWEREVFKVFGIKPGVIGSGIYHTDSPITISNIQTVKNHAHSLSKEYGLVIMDEVHHLPANTFKETLDRLKCRYKLGLSGTLRRKDQKHILISDYIGEKTFIPPKENTKDPIIKVFESSCELPGGNRMPWANRVTALLNNSDYIHEIVSIADAQAKRGHKVLVVGDRIDFLYTCADILSDSAVCITSRTKNQKALEQQVISGERPILFGTTSIFKEGISINPLSCLILGSPINNDSLLEQLAGRVMRLHKGKLDPEVVDIKLQGATGYNQFKTRMSFYLSEGWEVVYV